MKTAFIAALLAVSSLTVLGCKSSHQEGVKSNLRSQWTSVAADTMATTDAAKDVLTAEGLKDVTGSATKLDGKAMGKMSDNTNVVVIVKKENDLTSSVSVTVGMLGDAAVGAEMAKKIKVKAEGMAPMRPVN